jgi:hypothetical protein
VSDPPGEVNRCRRTARHLVTAVPRDLADPAATGAISRIWSPRQLSVTVCSMARTSRLGPVPAQPNTLVNCQARPHDVAPECERHLPLARLVVVARGHRDGKFEARHDVEPLTTITKRADPMLHVLPRLGRDQQLAQVPVPAVAGTLTGLPSPRRRETRALVRGGIPRYGSARDLRSWRRWAIAFLGAGAAEGGS